MLIITRRVGEAVNIGNDVVVRLLGMHGSQAKIGIEAPRDVPVHREEIFEELKRQRLEAAAHEAAAH